MTRVPRTLRLIVVALAAGCAQARDQALPMITDSNGGAGNAAGAGGDPNSGALAYSGFSGQAGTSAYAGAADNSAGGVGSSAGSLGAPIGGGGGVGGAAGGSSGSPTGGSGIGGSASGGSSGSGGGTAGAAGIAGGGSPSTGGAAGVACTGPGEYPSTAMRCYRIVSGDKKSWDAALADCLAWGGSLAALTDQAAVDAVQVHLADTVWIGATDSPTHGTTPGTFIWSSGEPFGFANWNPGEPNNSGGNELCVQMLPAQGKWNDSNCASASGYVCEAFTK